MNFRHLLFAVLPALIFTSFVRGADSTLQDRFTEARIAFDQGDFAKARELGEALVDEQHYSPALFQLLGNTRYRQGDIGHAALFYQRAALLPAPSAETRQNISHIHERTGNFFFPSNGIRQQFASWFSRSQWLAIAITCGWVLTLCCIIAFCYVRAGNLRALLLTIAILALVGETSSVLGWLWNPTFEKVRNIAVITASEANAYTAASTTSKSLSSLPPGSLVRQIKDQGSWAYVEFHNENPSPEGKDFRGWVQTKSITTLWPYDPACLE